MIEVDSDVQDLLGAADDDDDKPNHWLWGSVHRIRRSLNRLIGTDDDLTVAPKRPNAAEKLNRKKSILERQKAKEKMALKKEAKKQLNETGKSKKLKGRRTYANRLKRQDEDEGDAYEDDENDDADNGSGENDINTNVYNSDSNGSVTETESPNVQTTDMDRPERLCKNYFLQIIVKFHYLFHGEFYVE